MKIFCWFLQRRHTKVRDLNKYDVELSNVRKTGTREVEAYSICSQEGLIKHLMEAVRQEKADLNVEGSFSFKGWPICFGFAADRFALGDNVRENLKTTMSLWRLKLK